VVAVRNRDVGPLIRDKHLIAALFAAPPCGLSVSVYAFSALKRDHIRIRFIADPEVVVGADLAVERVDLGFAAASGAIGAGPAQRGCAKVLL
jgi:hypothetical protein